MTRPLLVIAPHPDDEILGAGGLLARACAAGTAGGVIVLTDGSASDPAVGGAQLAQVREAECRQGLIALLGEAPPLLFLQQPDGAFDARAPDLRPGSQVATFCAQFPGATVLVTDPADGHPDHKAAFGFAARIAHAELADRIEVMPVSQRVDGIFDAQGWDLHVVGAFAGAKEAALAAHHSQLASRTGFAIPPEVQEAMLRREYLRPAFDRRLALPRPQVVAATHFDALFARSEDPWGYDTTPYERDRFDRTTAMLGGRTFTSALELGCANGALTQRLAPFCDRLLAIDTSAVALDAARRRMVDVAGVSFAQARLPEALPGGPFDLIVVSDFLYYLGLEGVAVLAAGLTAAAAPSARIIVANYLGETDCALSGEMAAETLLAHSPGWTITRAVRTDRLRIEHLDRG